MVQESGKKRQAKGYRKTEKSDFLHGDVGGASRREQRFSRMTYVVNSLALQ